MLLNIHLIIFYFVFASLEVAVSGDKRSVLVFVVPIPVAELDQIRNVPCPRVDQQLAKRKKKQSRLIIISTNV